MAGPTSVAVGVRYIRRFGRFERVLHGFLMFSFLGLAATGLPLFFSTAPWASRIAHAFGGFNIARGVHRVCAVVMIAVFLLHLAKVLRRVLVEKDYSVFWGPRSLVPQPRDLTEMFAHFRWFVGRGPRPAFDRYTYWEKFDYWAVFWGMAIIGGSGLLLWFPTFFARVLPGWLFNVAMVIHGEEALLAVCFIFTIHFFNGHLRPEKFPMDMVIFTGSVSERELAHERPAEYERLQRSGQLEGLVTDAPDASVRRYGRAIGATALTIGLTLIALILYAFVAA
jgi:cytochrome b subunit of formate dehydrogenase